MNKKLKPKSYLSIIGDILYSAIWSGMKKSALRYGRDQLEEIKSMMEGMPKK